jgi:hypothetical protein
MEGSAEMSTAIEAPPEAPKLIDTSNLPQVDLVPMRALKITDTATLAKAREYSVFLQGIEKTIEETFAGPKQAAHKVWKWFTTTETAALKPLQETRKYLTDEGTAYLQREELSRRQLEEKMRREAAERALAEHKAAQAQKAAEMMPWDLVDNAGTPPEPPPVIPTVTIAPPPPPDGVGTRKQPWTFEWFDKAATLRAALENPDVMELICLDEAKVKALAKAHENRLEKFLPGVRGKRDVKVNYR